MSLTPRSTRRTPPTRQRKPGPWSGEVNRCHAWPIIRKAGSLPATATKFPLRDPVMQYRTPQGRHPSLDRFLELETLVLTTDNRQLTPALRFQEHCGG